MGRSGTRVRKSASARHGASKARRKPRRVEKNAILATISSVATLNPPPKRYPLNVELRARAIAAHNRGDAALAQRLFAEAQRLEGNPKKIGEAWRKLKPGDRVKVAHPISDTEKKLLGRVFVIDRFSKPHGYAVVKDEHGAWHVHPEALVKNPGGRRKADPHGYGARVCAAPLCTKKVTGKSDYCSSHKVESKRTAKNPGGGLIGVRRRPVSAAAHVDGFKENYEGCKLFHDAAPNRVRVFDFDDGSDELTERVVFVLGDAEVTFNTVRDEDGNEVQIPTQRIQSVYRVRGKRSSKAGRQFVHSATEDGGKPSLKVCDARTHILMDLGNYGVDTFIRERKA